MERIFLTSTNDFSALIARVTLGIVILPHGLQKLLGVFGGYGFTATIDFFSSSMGIPSLIGFLIVMGESFGALFLILGLISRISSAGILIIMIGAIFYVKKAANLTGDGAYELDLILLASSLVVIVAGPGRASLAHVIKKLPRYLH